MSLIVGLDIVKHVFQVHAIDSSGEPVHRRKLRRAEVLGFFSKLEPGVIAIEACGTAYFRARALLEKKPPRLVTVALANKMARVVWAVLTRGESFRLNLASVA